MATYRCNTGSLRPGGLRPFFGAPADTLADLSVPLSELWSRDGNRLGVVGQVGADAGQVRHDGNAKFTKVPGGADARPQQQRRGAVRASAQNDPGGPDLAARGQPYAGHLVPLDQQAADFGAAAYREGRPWPAGRQEALRSAFVEAMAQRRVGPIK